MATHHLTLTLTRTSLLHLKLRPRGRQMAQHISWSQGRSTSPLISESILRTFTLVWTTPDTGTSSLVGDLLNLEINKCVFSNLDCFLKLFPVLYMFKCPILIKVSAAVCIPPTLGVLHDVDYFQIFYPNIFYQAGKFANNAIETINVGYVVSVNISNCFD